MDHSTRRSSWIAWVLTLLIPLLALGCSKAPMSISPGYVDEDYGGYGGDYGSDYYAEAEMAVDYGPGGGAMASRQRAKAPPLVEPRREFADKHAEAPPPPPMEPAPSDSSTLVDQPTPTPGPEPGPQAAAKRQIIYTATMQVGVHDVEHAIATAEALPEQLGGWLHQRSDNQLILRIPAEKLQQAMDAIAELGVVDYRLLEALDVTAQYTDLESRIRVLEEMQIQLQALLEQATSVEQALEIRKALDAITLELELARGQMRELAKSIAFSTLILRFVERGPAVSTPSSNDPFGWVDQLGVEITEYR
ncbi:MAG: DUF4349 domain-containing protein [Enhygromyxa sp.]